MPPKRKERGELEQKKENSEQHVVDAARNSAFLHFFRDFYTQNPLV